ncbi:hypothetical protein ACFQX6_23630 [Streptosporangium lutulentum]
MNTAEPNPTAEMLKAAGPAPPRSTSATWSYLRTSPARSGNWPGR